MQLLHQQHECNLDAERQCICVELVLLTLGLGPALKLKKVSINRLAIPTSTGFTEALSDGWCGKCL